MTGFFSLIDRVLEPIRRLAYYATKILPGVSRLLHASAQLQTAVILFAFLFVTTVVVIVMHLTGDGADEVKTKLSVLLILTFIIPLLVYFGLKLLLTPARSLYPDIDEAWQACREGIDSADLPLKRVPLFLILGGGPSQRLENVMAAARLNLLVKSTSPSSAPLTCYATPDAVYLCFNNLGALAAITASTEGAGNRFDSSVQGVPLKGKGTLDAFPAFGSEPTPFPAGGEFVPPSSPVMIGRTIDLEQVLGSSAVASSKAAPSPIAHTAGLSIAELRRQRDRLEYGLSLLRNARAPVCPLNGVLTLLPFHTILAAGSNADVALHQDLGVIADALQLRASCCALVTDMEREPGFLELVRRVGPRPAAVNRFGQKFNTLSPPIKEQLLAFGQQVCGVYEDWTYQLFDAPGALQQQGNGQLFALMCKVRGRFRRIFTATLANGFGCEGVETSERHQLFSGCYYAATGANEAGRAFVQSVFEKLSQGLDDLEWMPAAVKQDEKRRTLANLALVGSFLMLVGFVIYFVKFRPDA